MAHAGVQERVRAAVAGGARLVDLGQASAAAVAAARAVAPDLIICADAPGADITRDPAVAEGTGATLLRSLTAAAPNAGPSDVAPAGAIPAPEATAGPAAAPAAGAVPPSTASTRLDDAALVAAAPVDVGWLVADGWQVVVDVDAAEPAATIAVAAVCTWLGAKIIRTRLVGTVRQAIEMVESIQGIRAPLRPRRGLA